jgi:hypothetical protein
MAFTHSARAKLLSHLRLNSNRGDEALEWLELELRWAFYEELGFATRYTHPQLLAALRALARCDPTAQPGVLAPAFLKAVQANERISARNNYLPDDLGPLPYDDATLQPLVPWIDLGIDELLRRADAMFQAVRGADPTIGNGLPAGHSGNRCVKERSSCVRECGSRSSSVLPPRANRSSPSR